MGRTASARGGHPEKPKTRAEAHSSTVSPLRNRTSVRDSSRETCIWEMPSSSRQLPAPAPASSLAADDAPLGLYSAAHLIQNSYSAGLAHADALRRLTAAGEVDPVSPWTLLRGASGELRHACGSSTAPGAASADAAPCRCGVRTCATGSSTGHLPCGSGLTGAQRLAEIRALADQLGLAPLTASRSHQILLTAAPAAGLTAVKVERVLGTVLGR